MPKFVLYLTIALCTLMSVHSQDLQRHRWKHRILVVYSNSMSNENFSKQLKELKTDSEGLEDRKLLIYQVVDKKVKHGLNPETNWYPTAVFKTDYEPISPFEIQLIGLDGGLKLRQNEVLSLEKLFETIDQMPMRQREMKEN